MLAWLSIALCVQALVLAPESTATLQFAAKPEQALTSPLPVFYITNREESESRGSVAYGAKRSPKLTFGLSTVALPPADDSLTQTSQRKKGKPKIKPQPARLVPMASADDFFQALNDARRKSIDRRVIVFVPGYACGLKDAIEIGEELGRGTKLPVVVFSWPSRNNAFAYTQDESSAEWSLSQFSEVLRQMDEKVGNDKVVLVAYSMGARIVSWGLERRLAENGPATAKYSQVLFCSPDVDTGVFINFAGILVRSCPDNRVYVSRKDLRLRVSAFLHGAIRLGTRGKAMPEMDGVRMEDYTDVDRSLIGHSIPFELLARDIASTVTAAEHPQAQPLAAN